MNQNQRTILLIEDDPNDTFLLKYAFEMAGILNPIQVLEDGQQAIDYLTGANQFSDRKRYPFPALVLLDLKLPVRMGFDVLRWIRDQPRLRSLLVLVLTSSSDPRDIDEAYRLGARCYLVKPLSVPERLQMARTIKQYWLELNQFPSSGETR